MFAPPDPRLPPESAEPPAPGTPPEELAPPEPDEPELPAPPVPVPFPPDPSAAVLMPDEQPKVSKLSKASKVKLKSARTGISKTKLRTERALSRRRLDISCS